MIELCWVINKLIKVMEIGKIKICRKSAHSLKGGNYNN